MTVSTFLSVIICYHPTIRHYVSYGVEAFFSVLREMIIVKYFACSYITFFLATQRLFVYDRFPKPTCAIYSRNDCGKILAYEFFTRPLLVSEWQKMK